MKHVTAYIFAAILSLSVTAFAADTYRNATFTFNSSFAVDYSFGNVQVGTNATSGTVIGDPFAIQNTGNSTNATSGTVIGDPFMVQNANGTISTNATSGTVIGDPFSIMNPQSNSTDMQGLLGYMSTQPFVVQVSGMYVTYNVMESTNNPLMPISGYCNGANAVVELVDASTGNVLSTLTPMPSFCGISWLTQLSSAYQYNFPDSYIGKMVYVRMHIAESASYQYTSFGSSSMTNLGWSPFAGLLGKQIDGTVAASSQLLGNYPNPVANITTISIQNTVGVSSLKVYNVLGQMVADLSSQVPQTNGTANVVFDASQLPNGLYIYRMQNADGTASQREMIVKK